MRGISRWIALGLFVSVPTVAWADVISDEEGQCRSKNEGDACSVGDESGACAKDTCTRNDYSEGVPPKTISVECLICKVGEAPSAAKVEASAKEDAEQPTKVEAKGPEAKPAKSGGCTVGTSPPVALGLLLIGAAVCRRRRQSHSPTP